MAAMSNLASLNEGPKMTTALLLIAHGSRNSEANDDLHYVVAALRRRGPYDIVEASFLEMAEPGIRAGGEKCVDLGADRVILLPYFLSPGIHVRQDLQAFRDKLAQEFHHVTFLLGEPLGRHEALIDLLALRAKEADDAKA
jgi:sirohydrochlorin ferrochelatase